MAAPKQKLIEEPISFLNVGTRILLKDAMDQYLRTLGDFKTHYASTMQNALRVFKEHHFHFIVTEANFPDGSAYRLLKQLGGNNHENDLYVVFAIEEKTDEMMALAEELEVNAVLVKPFAAADLKAQIDRYLGWKKLPKEPWKQMIRESNLAFQERRYRDAEVQLLEAVKLQPNNPQVYYHTGLYYLRKPDPGQAIRNFERALELKPKYIQAISALGSVYLNELQLDKAEEHLSMAHKLSPLNPERCIELVRLNLFKSIEACKSSLRMDPSGSTVRFLLGKLFAIQKDYVGCVREMESLVHSLKDQQKLEAQTFAALARKLGGIAK